MPIIRDTHKWKPRQKFCSLTEESKEVGEQSVVCSANKHGPAFARDGQLQVAKEMPSAISKLMFALTGWIRNKEEALISPL